MRCLRDIFIYYLYIFITFIYCTPPAKNKWTKPSNIYSHFGEITRNCNFRAINKTSNGQKI